MLTATAPATLRYAFVSTAPGPLLAVTSERGLRTLLFVKRGQEGAVLDTLHKRYPELADEEDMDLARELEAEIADYLAGRETSRPLDVDGTPFQKAVWQALRRIPHGRTSTYAAVAREVGSPRAVRAVGQACGANPIALLIPCHRVLREGGSLGGYYWGLDVKRALLELERRTAAGTDSSNLGEQEKRS